MNINATIFVQIINFGICYLILRYLFLRPAMSEINQEEEKREMLSHTIETLEHTLAKQQKMRDAAWDECRDYFKNQSPDHLGTDELFLPSMRPPQKFRPIDQAEIAHLIQKTSAQLVDTLEKSQ